MSRLLRGVAFALMLTLALAGPAMAATSGTTTDSVVVPTTIAITGVPATVSYGSVIPGTRSAVQSATLGVSGNAGWKLTVAGTDLVNGGSFIANSQREGWLAAGVGYIRYATDPGNFFGNSITDGVGTFAEDDGSGVAVSMPLSLALNVPSNTKAGTYSGTITFALIAK